MSASVFLRQGYEGTSIDDLLAATGLHRGSLYKAFASKRGLFLAALTRTLPDLAGGQAADAGDDALDLLLVALLERAPPHPEARPRSPAGGPPWPPPAHMAGSPGARDTRAARPDRDGPAHDHGRAAADA